MKSAKPNMKGRLFLFMLLLIGAGLLMVALTSPKADSPSAAKARQRDKPTRSPDPAPLQPPVEEEVFFNHKQNKHFMWCCSAFVLAIMILKNTTVVDVLKQFTSYSDDIREELLNLSIWEKDGVNFNEDWTTKQIILEVSNLYQPQPIKDDNKTQEELDVPKKNDGTINKVTFKTSYKNYNTPIKQRCVNDFPVYLNPEQEQGEIAIINKIKNKQEWVEKIVWAILCHGINQIVSGVISPNRSKKEKGTFYEMENGRWMARNVVYWPMEATLEFLSWIFKDQVETKIFEKALYEKESGFSIKSFYKQCFCAGILLVIRWCVVAITKATGGLGDVFRQRKAGLYTTIYIGIRGIDQAYKTWRSKPEMPFATPNFQKNAGWILSSAIKQCAKAMAFRALMNMVLQIPPIEEWDMDWKPIKNDKLNAMLENQLTGMCMGKREFWYLFEESVLHKCSVTDYTGTLEAITYNSYTTPLVIIWSMLGPYLFETLLR